MPTVASDRRLLLVGFDGFDWQVLRPLLEAGELPTFAQMIRDGASGKLATLQPTLSPILWNSIATGKRAGKHGIHGFTEVDPETGLVRPVTSTSRTCKAVWNILQQNGRRVNVINWFAGHPAEPVNGVAVSPLFVEGSGGPGTLHPAALREEWSDLRVGREEVTGEVGRLFVRDIAKIDQRKDPRLGQLGLELAKTFSVQTLALEAMKRAPWQFTAVYFRFTDILAHVFMRFHPPRMEGVPEELFHHYSDVVNSSYRLADLLLRNLRIVAGEDAATLVLSDHGFTSGADRPKPRADPFADVEQWHRQHGVLLAAGPGIRAGGEIEGAGLLDIAPTLLAYFGLPVGRDSDGRVLVEIFSEPGAPKMIESWETVAGDSGRHPPGAAVPEADAAELLRQFEALGYIAPLGLHKEAAAKQTRRQNRWNLARDYLDAGHDEAALPLLEELHAGQAEDIAVTLNLARCQRRLGLIPEARLTAGDALRLVPEGPVLNRVMAQLAMQAGEPAKALEHYAAVAAAGEPGAELHLEIARAHAANREWEKARAACAAALALEPDLAGAHLLLARIAIFQRQPDEAVAHALDALARQQNLAGAHLVLGRALLQLRQIDDAQLALETALVYDASLVAARRLLARLHAEFRQDVVGELKHRVAAEKIFAESRRSAQRVERLRAEAAARREERERKVWAETETIEGLDARMRREAEMRRQDEAGAGWRLEPGRTFVVVSGLPRSGTSLMMQMLAAGGLPPMADTKRAADEDNPEGYFEWQEIVRLPERPWLLEQALGKVVKVVSPLLTHLTARHRYRVIFMERAPAEIARSQEWMLRRRGQAVPADLGHIAELQAAQAGRTLAAIEQDAAFAVLRVPYAQVIAEPEAWARRIADFIAPANSLDPAAMARVVKPELYRNRLA